MECVASRHTACRVHDMTTETLPVAPVVGPPPVIYEYPPVPDCGIPQPRAAIYCRQSVIQEDGSNASPQMQRITGEGLCQARGYTPVVCFSDTGKSGWDPRVKRDGFDELMNWVRAKKIEVVIIFTLSRLTRQGALDALRIESEMRANGVALVSTREPYLDTGDAVGIGIFAIIAGLAQQESDTKSEFIVNSMAQARAVGGHVTGRAPYAMRAELARSDTGVTWRRLVPQERPVAEGSDWTETAVYRHMVGMATGGASFLAVANWLNDTGIPAPSQRPDHPKKAYRVLWSLNAVQRVLRDPRMSGVAADRETTIKWVPRTHEDGSLMRVHEGIIPEAEWYQLQEAIGDPVKRTGSGTVWLLSAWKFLYCHCGSTMTCTGTPGPRKTASYRCGVAVTRSQSQEYHGSNAIKQNPTDDYVAGRVFARMRALDTGDDNDLALVREVARRFARQTDTSGTARRAAELRAQIDHTDTSLGDLYAERTLYKGPVGTRVWRQAVETMQATRQACADELHILETQQADSVVVPIDQWYGDTDGDPLGEGSPWSTWSTAQRREFLNIWLDKVVVHPIAVPRMRVPVEDRLELVWAQPATEDVELDQEEQDRLREVVSG